MIDRIGTLNLHYRVRGGALAPALAAGLDRALQAGLGDALGQRLAALLGDDRAVTVVRELDAPVALAMAGCTLDSQVVDAVSRACGAALADLLSRDPDEDSVRRFDDETAFAGAFIVSLLDGSAWDRWYYGAFRRYRRADMAATLRAVLDEAGVNPVRLFAWLARHGRLGALLDVLPAAEARRLLGGGPRARATDGSAALVDCARRLLAILAPGDEARCAQRIDAFLARRPIDPDWTSSASLSAWIVQLLRAVLGRAEGEPMPAPGPAQRDALHALLAGPLDWLDVPWMQAQLGCAPAAPPTPRPPRAAPGRPLLTPRQQRILQRLVDDLQQGRLVLPGGAGMDATIVHAVAQAARHAGEESSLDRGVIAVIELAVRAAHEAGVPAPAAAQRAGTPGRGQVAGTAPAVPGAGGDAADALRAAGAPALALRDALRASGARLSGTGMASAMAGVFLLARAIEDMRLPALAKETGVPAAPLLAGLARLWTGQDLATDCALPLWSSTEAETADGTGADLCALDALNAALLAQLVERRMLGADAAHATLAADAAALGGMPTVEPRLGLTACLLLRAWTYWLPGLGDASPRFLVANSIRRHGSVGVGGQRIEIALDPAPLDIVLRMAGYLAPLGPLGWLGGRGLVFSLRDAGRGPP